MVDGLAMAETTPGPLIMVLQFVGFLAASRFSPDQNPIVAGIAGSLVMVWATFAPCFLFVLAGAPYAEWLGGRRTLDAALNGIMAAVVGVILNLAVWFSIHVLFGETTVWSAGPFDLELPRLGSLDPTALVLAVLAAVHLPVQSRDARYPGGGRVVLGLLWKVAMN